MSVWGSVCAFAPLHAVFLDPDITWSLPRPLIGPPSLPWKVGNSRNSVNRKLGNSETWKLGNLETWKFCWFWWISPIERSLHAACKTGLSCLQLLTQVTTDSWQTGFYGMTLAFAMVFNINDSVFQVFPFGLLGLENYQLSKQRNKFPKIQRRIPEWRPFLLLSSRNLKDSRALTFLKTNFSSRYLSRCMNLYLCPFTGSLCLTPWKVPHGIYECPLKW